MGLTHLLHAVLVRLPGGVIASSGAPARSIVGIAGSWYMARHTFPSGGWRMKKGMAMNTRDLFWFLLVAALVVTWLVFVTLYTLPLFLLEVVCVWSV
jgi:hypothetical protein